MVENARRCLGRTFGALVLSAFVLYGSGVAMLGRPLGTAMILLNSAAVASAGYAGMRALGGGRCKVGKAYFCGRIAEALLLGAGAVLAAAGQPAANDSMYLWAMVILGIVSVPFCYTLREDKLLPGWLALWGVLGYALFACAAAVNILTAYPLPMLAVAPGGLFELFAGVYLVILGFKSVDHPVGAELPLLQPEPVSVSPQK